MAKLKFNITMSLDGYVAGPGPSLENPLGEGGVGLHEWAFATRSFRAAHGMDGGECEGSNPHRHSGTASMVGLASERLALPGLRRPPAAPRRRSPRSAARPGRRPASARG